jgi:hypothetical protein
MTIHQLAKPGPSPGVRSQQYWRDHIDKVAVQRVQTPNQLAIRRRALIVAVADYLVIVAGEYDRQMRKAQPKPKTKAGLRARMRGSASTFNIARAQFKATWKCTDAWLATVGSIGLSLEQLPTASSLARYLEFPAPQDAEESRSRGKRSRGI